MSKIICPYCKGLISKDYKRVVMCYTCKTLHHKECFNNGCAVFGCIGVRTAPNTKPKLFWYEILLVHLTSLVVGLVLGLIVLEFFLWWAKNSK